MKFWQSLFIVIIIFAGIIFVIDYAADKFWILESYTDTEDVKWHDGLTHHYLRGVHTDYVDNDATDEIFTKTQYVASWFDNGYSEPIFATAKYRVAGEIWVYEPDWYEYRVYWSDSPNGPWTAISTPKYTEPFVSVKNPGQKNLDIGWFGGNVWWNFEPYWFNIRGSTYKQFVKIEVKVHLTGWIPSRDIYATDICRLISGVGEVWITPDDDSTPYLFTVGDTVTFNVNTGFSGVSTGEPGRGWTLTLYDPDGNAYMTWDIGDDKRGHTETWTIPQDAWRSTWDNEWKIVLYNAIIDQSEERFLTIDREELAPDPPTIEFTGGDKVGEQVIVILESTHPLGEGISHFYVDVKYQDTGEYIINHARYEAANNRAVVTFTPLHGATDVIVRAYAVDASGRPSGYSQDAKYIERPGGGGESNWWIYAMVAAGASIAAIGGVVYIRKKEEIKQVR